MFHSYNFVVPPLYLHPSPSKNISSRKINCRQHDVAIFTQPVTAFGLYLFQSQTLLFLSSLTLFPKFWRKSLTWEVISISMSTTATRSVTNILHLIFLLKMSSICSLSASKSFPKIYLSVNWIYNFLRLVHIHEIGGVNVSKNYYGKIMTLWC